MADKTGCRFSSHDNRRSAMEGHSDPLHDRSQAIAADLMETLPAGYQEQQFNRVVIRAEPPNARVSAAGPDQSDETGDL